MFFPIHLHYSVPAEPEVSSENVGFTVTTAADPTPVVVAAPPVDQQSTVTVTVDSVDKEKQREPEPVAESKDTEPRTQCK